MGEPPNRLPAIGGGGGDVRGPGFSTVSPVSSGALLPVLAFGTTSTAVTAQPSPPLPSASLGGTPVAAAIGSPDILTGRPSIEALSRDQTDLPTVRVVVVVMQPDLDGHEPKSGLVKTPDSADPGSRALSGQDADALVATDGPGGFALLGAAAIGHRPRIYTPPETKFGASGATSEPAPFITGEVMVPDAAIAPLEEQTLATERSDSARPWLAMPKSLFSGLGLAIALTLNAALSQPFAGFDYLASRFDSTRGKANRDRHAANR